MKEEPPMKIRVDRERCAGHADCAAIYPELFKLDEEGYLDSDGKEIPAEGIKLAVRAAANCPEQAIAIEES